MNDDDETDFGDWPEDYDDDEWRDPLCLGCEAGETECLELGGCCTRCDHR